jgi:signal peptidase I
VVVVLSGSMEPGFQRGDILFLNMGSKPARTGEIVVFNIDGRDIPIVHRIIKVHERANENHLDILTKVRLSGGLGFEVSDALLVVVLTAVTGVLAARAGLLAAAGQILGDV